MASTYTWTLQSGTLPPGLSLATGETDLDSGISGTPTTSGTYNFTVRITNDISGDFDDQAYTMDVYDPQIEITPDLGTNIEDMFDASNPKLVIVDINDLVDVTGQDFSSVYNPVRKLRFEADLGSGTRTYEIPEEYTRGIKTIGRRYLWRAAPSPNDIREIFIV